MIRRADGRGMGASLSAGRLGPLVIVLFLTLCAWTGFTGPAWARIAHVPEGTFGPLHGLGSVAVDNSVGPSGGSIYVGEINFSTEEGKTSVRKLKADGTITGVELAGTETPAGFFSFLDLETSQVASGVAVDSSAGTNAGNVYLPDIENGVVDVFDESGTYICQITGDAVSAATECAGAAGSAVPSGGLEPLAVAVNPNNGELAVGDQSGVIYEFNEAGEYDGEINDPHIVEPGSIAFDSTGALYVVNGTTPFGSVNGIKLDPNGNFASVVTENKPLSVGVDLGDDHVYFGAPEMEEFDPAGNPVSTFGGYSVDVDVNQVSGRVYTTQSSTIWSPLSAIPDVTTGAATNVANVSATVNGSVDPDVGGDVTSCEFEYGATTSYGSTTPCSPPTPYSGPTPVSADLNGLTAATNYHFRIRAAIANGVPSVGEDKTFRTKGPTVDSEAAIVTDRFAATLEASINPNGGPTDYFFEYVTQKDFEEEGFANPQSTPSASIGSGEASIPVSQVVSGLLVGTKYHYRARASSTQGSALGSDQTFETKPVATIVGQYPTAGLHTATLEAEINPDGLAGTCHMQWVSDAKFQQSGYAEATMTPCKPEDLGSGTSIREAEVELSGLALEATYHIRFVVENSSGILFGKDKLFSTFGIKEFSVKLLNKAGEPETRAGAHPFEYVTRIALNTNFKRNERISPTGLIKDILTEAPPGLMSNPNAIPKCTRRTVEEKKCTGDAQIGTMRVGEYGGSSPNISDSTKGIFNTYPSKGKSASFTTNEFDDSFAGFFDMEVRGGDGAGTNSGVGNITERAVFYEVETRMWGVPADPAHNARRECAYVIGCVSNAEPKPFMRMPTACTGPTVETALINTWGDPSAYARATHELPGVTGCSGLEFEPSIEARPTTKLADSPSGLHFDLRLPQNEDPQGLGTPDLKGGVIALPRGLAINPAGANGLASCSPAQIKLHVASVAHCPETSKIGTVQVESPMVHFSVKAGLYLATPYDNPFGAPFALYMADPEGASIKTALRVDADPDTGRLTLSFDETPQLPFDDFKVDLFSGALAPLRTPSTCGVFSSTAMLTPWSAPESGPPASLADSYKISGGANGSACVSNKESEPNAPTFSAGTQAPIAGKYSPFVLNLRREDGSQEFSAMTVTPPPGLVAKLAGTTYCPDAALVAAAAKRGAAETASPSCPSSSRIGSVVVGAGVGPAPYNAQGTAYLAGPYKGAPLSMAAITPAVAGPLDLGTVVVRVALYVDPETTRITAKADPIPEILQGIPLAVRSVAVKLDRPDFSLNPTSCNAMSFKGTLRSTLGREAPLGDRFQLGDCTNLPFKPKLETRLFGKTGRGGHPKLRTAFTLPPGNANIASASLALPPSEVLDRGHIHTVCSGAQFAAEACPSGSIYGWATAKSPLLGEPLRGPLYLRSSDHRLPDLVADLRGQVHVVLAGRIDAVQGRIRTSFEALPDTPISKLTLTLPGGGKGLLQNATNVCKGEHNAVALLDAHNGLVHDLRPVLKSGKCSKANKHRRGAKRRRSSRRGASLVSGAGL